MKAKNLTFYWSLYQAVCRFKTQNLYLFSMIKSQKYYSCLAFSIYIPDCELWMIDQLLAPCPSYVDPLPGESINFSVKLDGASTRNDVLGVFGNLEQGNSWRSKLRMDLCDLYQIPQIKYWIWISFPHALEMYLRIYELEVGWHYIMYNRVDLSEENFPKSIQTMFYGWENASGSAIIKKQKCTLFS